MYSCVVEHATLEGCLARLGALQVPDSPMGVIAITDINQLLQEYLDDSTLATVEELDDVDSVLEVLDYMMDIIGKCIPAKVAAIPGYCKQIEIISMHGCILIHWRPRDECIRHSKNRRRTKFQVVLKQRPSNNLRCR